MFSKRVLCDFAHHIDLDLPLLQIEFQLYCIGHTFCCLIKLISVSPLCSFVLASKA
jgi:hypothetical protein